MLPQAVAPKLHRITPNRCLLYPRKADMDQRGRDVRFVPKADIARSLFWNGRLY
jgi:hypothetical protein